MIIRSSVMFVTSSIRMFTLAVAEHMTSLNLLRITFNPSQVFTSVQGSGVLSYETALVPFIVVVFIWGQFAIFLIY